jgi:hypothetical protein
MRFSINFSYDIECVMRQSYHVSHGPLGVKADSPIR